MQGVLALLHTLLHCLLRHRLLLLLLLLSAVLTCLHYLRLWLFADRPHLLLYPLPRGLPEVLMDLTLPGRVGRLVHWSAFYRLFRSAFYRLFSLFRLDYSVLTRCFVYQTLAQIPADGPYVAVVDGVHLPRSSQRSPGTSWLTCPRTPPWKPGIHRAQRFVHLAALLPRWQGYSRA